MTNQNINKEIKKRVQAIEKEIPGELEKSIMKEFNQISRLKTSMTTVRLSKPLYQWHMAAAAFIFLGILLLGFAFSFLFHQKPVSGRSNYKEDVIINDTWVEGHPVKTFIVEQKDPDLTIIWIDKTP
jgi:hypothetical protein